MSLYEQFYSDINKNYMFNMINDIILEKTQIEIKKDPQNYELYVNNFDEIFNKGEYEEITDINKVLLDHHVKFFIEKIEKATVNTDLSTLMEERKKFDQDLETKKITSSNIDKLIENINNEIKSLNPEISLVVINDASSQQIIDEYPNIENIHSILKRGKTELSTFQDVCVSTLTATCQ